MPNKDPKIQKENQRKHYLANKQKYLNAQQRKRQRAKEFIAEYKKDKACQCGENHPACLEFHHRDEKTKESTIADAMYNWGVERIKKEVAKCDLLCANCHRKLHYEEMKHKGIKLLYEVK